MSIATHMDVQITGLHASSPQPLPFAPSLHIRAFLLERDQGNVLVYSTGELRSDAPAMDDLGGLSRWYLNHRHEAMFISDAVGAPLFVHENERRSVERAAHVRAAFSRRHTLDDDFEAIPTPGHTPGATAYLWHTGDLRVLFTGDTIYLRGGEWRGPRLDTSDPAGHPGSLPLLRELEFDVLVPWIAGAGEPHYALTTVADARGRIDAIVQRVWGSRG